MKPTKERFFLKIQNDELKQALKNIKDETLTIYKQILKTYVEVLTYQIQE